MKENTEMNSAKWHWGEGMKYALEGIKLLFLLNGAAAISVLTFIGNTKVYLHLLVFSLMFFALGSAAGVFTMIFAYLTQLHYGNVEFSNNNDEAEIKKNKATKYHMITYVFMILGIVLFVLGACFSALGLWNVAPTVIK